MRIYRVEHKDILNDTSDHFAGPYIISGDEELEEFSWGLGMAHTDWENDHHGHKPPKAIDSEWVCGLQSKERAQWWFEGFHSDLDRFGFHLAIYEVEDGRWMEDEGQLTFHPAYAARVETMPVSY
jgi:hypothetical protein